MTSNTRVFKISLWGIIALCFAACEIKPVDKKTLFQYVSNKEHGLIQEHTCGDVIYSLRYRPLDLVVEQELQSNPKARRDSLKSSCADCLYFVLSISQDSSEIFSRLRTNYAELLTKIAFGLKEQVRLVGAKQSQDIYLSDFIYPRLYGGTPNTSVLLCFKSNGLKHTDDYAVYIKDFINDDPEELKFTFSKRDLDRIPPLKL